MSTRRKRTTTGIQQAPNYIPLYYSYPQYGYIPPPVYDPVYTYPTLPYNNSGYIYYPVNEYGQVIGPPTNFPPIDSRYYQEYYPYPDYTSTRPTHGSPIHSPRSNRMLYDDHHYSPPSNHRYEQPRRESLPPIYKHPSTSARAASSNDVQYPQFVVRNLTEHGSRSSELSNKNPMERIKHHDQLRTNYH